MQSPFEITVIFTQKGSTAKAIDVACSMARGLTSRVRLIVPHVVPYPVPLTEPLVDRDFLERQFATLPGPEDPMELLVDIRICRDRWQMLRDYLTPDSVLVISREFKLAAALEAAGHSVVFVN